MPPFPFPKKARKPPTSLSTEPLIGALRSVITTTLPSSPQNAMLLLLLCRASVSRRDRRTPRKDKKGKSTGSPKRLPPDLKTTPAVDHVPPSTPPPVALALLHRGYHQETKENGKKSGNARSRGPGDEAKGWRSARRPSTQRRRPARRRRFRRPRGVPKPC